MTFCVFDPSLETLFAESIRNELEGDKAAIRAFKGKADLARKAFSGN